MSLNASFCQFTILISYVILMILNYNNMILVIPSTTIVIITCLCCLTAPETDDEERIVEVVMLETDTITIQIGDEFVSDIIEPSVIEQTAVKIIPDSYNELNTPQAVMVTTVVPSRFINLSHQSRY